LSDKLKIFRSCKLGTMGLKLIREVSEKGRKWKKKVIGVVVLYNS